MVPWWTLILLTAGFFIREAIMRSKEKPTDYDSGYRQAIKDVSNLWNDDIKRGKIIALKSSKLFEFTKEKLKGR